MIHNLNEFIKGIFMTKLLILFSLLLNFAFAAVERHVQMGATFFTEGEDAYVAVSLKNDKKWHTYWKNPGDAGIPIKIQFFVNNKKVKLKELEWPTPKRYIEQGGVLAYGYSATNHFYFQISKEHQALLRNKNVKVKGHWLVCKEICIPGQDELSIQVNSDLNGKSHPFDINLSVVKENLNKLPKTQPRPSNLEIYLTKAKEDNKLALQYTYTNFDIDKFTNKSNLLTPFPAPPFDYKHEKLFWDEANKTLYGRIYIDWDGIYEEPEQPLPEDGIFTKSVRAKFLLNLSPDIAPTVIEHTFYQFSMTGDESLDNFFKTLTPIDQIKKADAEPFDAKNMLYYILFAFLGGLILNLMPCVLPVISLKLFGLVVHSDEPKSKIMKHNLAYSAGVILSFMVLALVVLLMKSGGEKVGWGFQLQSPGFVFSMMVVMFVMALNMFGLFEFVTPGGKTLGNAQIKTGVTGDFVNGILATILSTPCSAPFLGTALTFAFTTSNLNIFLMLFFVGVGLAFPFILTAIFPKLVSFLPRPGTWMDKLKYLLGFTLLLTFIWLYDVLVNLIDFSYAGIYLNTVFASLFFAFFLRKYVTRIFVWNVIFFLFPAVMTTVFVNNKGLAVDTAVASTSIKQGSLTWNKWSEVEMKRLANEKKWVFIDFTAKWCLTCKVNKKIVLETSGFEKFSKEKGVELLVADWTKRDDYITDFLRKYGIVGVPAYFVQKPDGKIVHLGETISLGKIKKHIK